MYLFFVGKQESKATTSKRYDSYDCEKLASIDSYKVYVLLSFEKERMDKKIKSEYSYFFIKFCGRKDFFIQYKRKRSNKNKER